MYSVISARKKGLGRGQGGKNEPDLDFWKGEGTWESCSLGDRQRRGEKEMCVLEWRVWRTGITWLEENKYVKGFPFSFHFSAVTLDGIEGRTEVHRGDWTRGREDEYSTRQHTVILLGQIGSNTACFYPSMIYAPCQFLPLYLLNCRFLQVLHPTF